jgi:hypothetical protein
MALDRPTPQGRPDIIDRQTSRFKEYHQMEQQIGRLIQQLTVVTILSLYYHLDRFLSYFLR